MGMSDEALFPVSKEITEKNKDNLLRGLYSRDTYLLLIQQLWRDWAQVCGFQKTSASKMFVKEETNRNPRTWRQAQERRPPYLE